LALRTSDSTAPRARRGRWHRVGAFRGRPCNSRGVSDVVATIILLALTVVLFAAIFAFVTSFPSPPAQSSNQFQAALAWNGTRISGVNITHLAGPQVPSNGLIYIRSARGPNQCFSGVPLTVAAGINTPVWTLGETWRGPFSKWPSPCTSSTVDTATNDNLTIYVLSQGNLLFSAVLPGQPFIAPPTIVATWVAPSPVLAGLSFKVFTTVSGNIGSHKAYVNLVGITSYGGATTPQKMWFNGSQSAWQYNVTGTNTTNVSSGTYYGIVNITGSSSQSASGAVAIVISPSFSGSVTPLPATVGKSTAATFAVSVTNFGAFRGSTMLVSIFLNNTTTGHPTSPTWTTSLTTDGNGWWVTNSTGTTIGAYSTVNFAPSLTSPSGTLGLYKITVSVTVVNSGFGSPGRFTFSFTNYILG
jgi:hypothetical protein